MKPVMSVLAVGALLGGFVYFVTATKQGANPMINNTGGVWEWQLDTQPFPSTNPGVIAVVPDGFDPLKPVEYVIYWRGNGSCIRVIAGDDNARCRPSGNVHRASKIISQFKIAGKNAVCLIVERIIESSDTTSFGNFTQPSGFAAFLRSVHDLLKTIYPNIANPAGLSMYSHSGGWSILAQCLRYAPVQVRDVVLLDSFYGDYNTFAVYAQDACRKQFPAQRFVSIHTGGTPTENTQRLVRELNRIYPNQVRSQSSAGTPAIQELQTAVYAKYSVINHSDVPTYYFGRILQSSFIPTIR